MTLQEEKELILRVVLQMAAKLIGEDGFGPFGATLGPGRNVKVLWPKDYKEGLTRDELESYWSRTLKKAIEETPGCKTVCSCADVRIPQDGKLHPAIFIHLEQENSPAEDIAYPYLKGDDRGVELGRPTTIETEVRAFSA